MILSVGFLVIADTMLFFVFSKPYTKIQDKLYSDLYSGLSLETSLNLSLNTPSYFFKY